MPELIVDGIELDGWSFQVSLKRYPTAGKQDALQGGRVYYLEVLKCEDLVCYYNHKWEVKYDPNDDVTMLCLSIMLQKWNRRIE